MKKERTLRVYLPPKIEEAILIPDKVGDGTEQAPIKIIWHAYNKKTLEFIGTIDPFPEYELV